MLLSDDRLATVIGHAEEWLNFGIREAFTEGDCDALISEVRELRQIRARLIAQADAALARLDHEDRAALGHVDRGHTGTTVLHPFGGSTL